MLIIRLTMTNQKILFSATTNQETITSRDLKLTTRRQKPNKTLHQSPPHTDLSPGASPSMLPQQLCQPALRYLERVPLGPDVLREVEPAARLTALRGRHRHVLGAQRALQLGQVAVLFPGENGRRALYGRGGGMSGKLRRPHTIPFGRDLLQLPSGFPRKYSD